MVASFQTKLDRRSEKLSRSDKVCLGSRVFNCLFDNVFDFVPVVSVDTFDLAVEMLLDLAKHFPFVTTGDERDGHTDATKTARAADTVQISLVVRFSRHFGAAVDESLWDVLHEEIKSV